MKKRCISLDVLRGMTVALMIVVNNPGSWSKVFPPLRHAAWDGCTPCDLVFPFFLFCVGASMAFALAKYTSLTVDALKKILKRGVLLYLVGLLLTAFPFYPSEAAMDPALSFGENWLAWLGRLRLVGVLPRIAMCYVLGSVLAIWLQRPKKIIMAIAMLSVMHIGGLLNFAGPEGAFSLEGNFARRIDLAIFGESHIYHGYGIPFDPEGLFGVLTGTCTILVGFLIGMLIRKESPSRASARILMAGAASVVFGLILSIWVPLNKPLWSVSYVFYTAGWAMILLSLLQYLIDVRGIEKPFFPFRAMGMNALALYVLSGLLMKCIWRYTDWDYTKVFGTNECMSLLFAVLFMMLHMVLAMILYKKKIFIKL